MRLIFLNFILPIAAESITEFEIDLILFLFHYIIRKRKMHILWQFNFNRFSIKYRTWKY